METIHVITIYCTNIMHYDTFLYFCLIRSRKTEEYLKWFPYYQTIFTICRIQSVRLVHKVHNAYMKKYVQKIYFSNKYDWFLKKIHSTIYIASIQSNAKQIITKKVVQKYLYTLDPLQLTHLVSEL